MNDRVHRILTQIHALEEELEAALQAEESNLRYRIEGKRVRFEEAVHAAHTRLRKGLLIWLREAPPRHLASAPLIYGMIIPLLAFDLCLSIYHSICFRLYRIPRVRRRDYIVVDRHHLAYLNVVEKLNCVYCGYANGLVAYAREITARTEQYWCPIKHARKAIGRHRRYAEFAPFGEAEIYQEELQQYRRSLDGETSERGGDTNH